MKENMSEEICNTCGNQILPESNYRRIPHTDVVYCDKCFPTPIFKMPEEAAEAFAFFQEHGYSITEKDNHRTILTQEWVERAIKSGALKNQ